MREYIILYDAQYHWVHCEEGRVGVLDTSCLVGLGLQKDVL